MNQKGLSLLEVLIASAIALVVLGAIYSTMEMAQKSSVAVERKIIVQQDARAALEIMTVELQMASYNPTFTTNIWTDPSVSCASSSTHQGYKGIQEATATSITIEMDLDASSAVGDETNEVIRYNYDTNNQYITRSTNCGGAMPFLGNSVGNPRDVRVVNNTANIPLFRYYDGDGIEITTGSLPARIPDIRRIEITLVVDTEAIDRALNRRRRAIYSNSLIPRNHAIN